MHVVERRAAVLVTAFLVDPAGCQAVVAKPLDGFTVTLAHPLGNRSLYDASRSPPLKRWPR